MSVIKVNNITSRDGTTGPVIAGIATVSSTSHFVVPTGDTLYRDGIGNENIVTNGLVLWLDAGKSNSYSGSGSTWYDLSGNGNNGTLVNDVTYSKENLGSLVFDGIRTYVSTPYSLNPSNAFTVECWFKLDVIKEWHNLCDAFVDGTNRNFQMFVSGTGTFEVFWRTASPTGGSISNTVDDKVYCGVFTYDGGGSSGTLYRYTEGIEDTSTVTLPGTGTFSSQTFSIGRRGDSSANGFVDGNIYAVRVYNRKLSQEEVRQNYNALRYRYK